MPGQAPLWTLVDGFYLVHDYLHYNDSRAEVQARKVADRRRKQRRPGDQLQPESVVVPSGIRLESAALPSDSQRRVSESPSVLLCLVLRVLKRKGASPPWRTGRVGSSRPIGRGSPSSAPAPGCSDRQSARLSKACDLCALWDDATLEKLARIFLTTDDEWISHTGREFSVFALKASWYDGRLREWETKQKAVRA